MLCVAAVQESYVEGITNSTDVPSHSTAVHSPG